MKVINRKSIEVVNAGGRAVQRFYLTVADRQLIFTAAVVRFCELKPGSFVHFLNDAERWEFFVSDDPDGFKLVETSRNNQPRKALRICSSGLVSMILTSNGFKKSKRFAIVKTDRMHDHAPIFRLSLENVSTSNR